VLRPLDLGETIVAQATLPGRGALAIVRLSGARAHEIGSAIAAPWPATPRLATHAALRDASGDPIDDALVIRYDAPASYTGQDAVEFITHGGVVVPGSVVAAAISLGARQAEPGEFTRRAVLEGKLDLLQAEAAGDLVAATSRAAQRTALRQLDGGLSRRVLALRDEIIALEALIAYDIDFPEEDDGPIAPERVGAAAEHLVASLQSLLDTAPTGAIVRDGALVVIAGVPNAGKSSLFNALLGESRAIVTEIPGTTRDAIEAVMDRPLWPIRLVDTAGLRDAIDPVERLGVGVSESYVKRASLVLVCGDDAASLRAAADAVKTQAPAVPALLVRTKADLIADATEAVASDCAVSAESGEGLAELLSRMDAELARRAGLAEADADAPILTQERHRYVIAQALDEARAFGDAWAARSLPVSIAAVHLRSAVASLESLIGRVDVEDVLDQLFSRFCVGK
jgi:tRNA modification GTPase